MNFTSIHFKYLVRDVIIGTNMLTRKILVECGDFKFSYFLLLETTKFYMTEIIIQPSERNFPIIPRYKWQINYSVISNVENDRYN